MLQFLGAALWSCLKSDSPQGKWQTEIRSGCGVPFVPCPGCLHFLPLHPPSLLPPIPPGISALLTFPVAAFPPG